MMMEPPAGSLPTGVVMDELLKAAREYRDSFARREAARARREELLAELDAMDEDVVEGAVDSAKEYLLRAARHLP